jgi:S-adenosylmethionine:tRNA ribosyltransferase-isomerase
MIHIDLKDYDYDLPDEKIAQYPLQDRDASRLLVYKDNKISEDLFRNIQNHIPSGSLLVFNDTKVIRARLIFQKDSGAIIEVFCLEPLAPADYSLSFSKEHSVEWKCLVGNTKKWKAGKLSCTFTRNNMQCRLYAEKISNEGDIWRIRFTWDPSGLTFGEVIETTGHIPLPPYINRPDEIEDSERYQTIYSMVKGSVAAPTAGLHFTKDVLRRLVIKDIHTTQLTLHVGAGTFQPVKAERILDHKMHPEHYFIHQKTIEAVLKNSGSVIAIGTTSVRTLESLYWTGLKIRENPMITPGELFFGQWEAYSMKNSLQTDESLETILYWMHKNKIPFLEASTRIIIVPGYNFKVINGMVTNFHQPKSTLILLISAWLGEDWKKVYDYALRNDFRFLSFGDSSLLLR